MPISSAYVNDDVRKPKGLNKAQSVSEDDDTIKPKTLSASRVPLVEESIGKLTLLNGSASYLEDTISELESLVLTLGGVMSPSPEDRGDRSNYSTMAQAVKTIPAFLEEIQSRVSLIKEALEKAFV